MSAPPPPIALFQIEAVEGLDRLDGLLAASENDRPDAAAFLAHARGFRSRAATVRLEGLSDLAATVERIAAGLSAGELRWDPRLHFAVQGALGELRDLVGRAGSWTEAEQRRGRMRSVTLAAVAAGYLGSHPLLPEANPPVLPISRFFPDHGPGLLERSPNPPCTLPQRFRTDMNAAAGLVAGESAALVPPHAGAGQPALTDGLRRALLLVSAAAESYSATSIAALGVTMARAALASPAERTAVQAFAALLQNVALTDQELAARIKEATLSWPGRRTPLSGQAQAAPEVVPRPVASPATPSAVSAAASASGEPEIVPIESLLYSGSGALAQALAVRDGLRAAWAQQAPALPNAAARALFDELSDLLDLAVSG